MKKKIIILSLAVFVILSLAVIYYRSLNPSFKWDSKKHTSDEYFYYQNCWLDPCSYIKYEDGYYFVIFENQLQKIYSWDGKKDKLEIICHNPNCEHNNEQCKACFNTEKYVGFNYSNGYFFYLEENENATYVCRCNSDGGSRVRVLEAANSKEEYNYTIAINNDGNHIYVAKNQFSGESNSYLIDYDMKNGGKKNIVFKSDVGEAIYVNSITDRQVLFEIVSVQNGKGTALYLWKKNTTEKPVKVNNEEGFGTAVLIGDDVAYTTKTANYILKKDGNQIALSSTGYTSMISNKNKLYVDNFPYDRDVDEPHVLKIYDTDGKLLETIDMPEGQSATLFMGESDEKLFAKEFSANCVWVLDRRKDNAEWVKIER